MHIPEYNGTLGKLAWPGQFFLSAKRASGMPDDWKSAELNGWRLQYSPDVHICQLLEQDRGSPAGWLVGLAVRGGRIIEGNVTVPHPSDLNEFGGFWAAIHLGWNRVYTDSYGHLSIVYDTSEPVISTNPKFIENKNYDESLRNSMGIPQKDNWYPFGLTPWMEISRLLPNHFLDLETGEACRYWPNDESVRRSSTKISLDDGIDTISSFIREGIDAVAEKFPVRISLTAGYDSRTVLACARRHSRKLQLVTHHFHPKTGRLDVTAAKRLARENDLPLTILNRRRSTEQQKNDWLMRTGECVAGANYDHIGTFSQDREFELNLTGHGGEVLKAKYHSDDAEIEHSPKELIARLRLPSSARIRAAAEDWLGRLLACGATPELVWDMLYLEQRNACWAGALRHGSPWGMGYWPLAHRRIMEAAVRIRVEQRQKGRVHRRIIEREWPELLEVPINDWWGWRKRAAGVQRGVYTPGRSLFKGLLAVRKRLQ